MELIDFASNTLPHMRDGNTISNGMWIRRGLPKLRHYARDWEAPKNKKLELVTSVKPNGDCCMFSWVEFDVEDTLDGMFLISTRSASTLAPSKDHFTKNSQNKGILREIGQLWFDMLSKLNKSQLADLKKKMSH